MQLPIIPSAVTIVTLLLLVKLGFWQLDRAAEKRALATEHADRLRMEPCRTLQSCLPLAAGRRVSLEGSRGDGPLVLLDNQSRRGRAGYVVFEPFVPASDAGKRWLVARGWVASDGHRDVVPSDIAAPLADLIEGRLANAPVAGVSLARDPLVERLAEGVVRVDRLDAGTLAALGYADVAPLVIEQTGPGATDALLREWPLPGNLHQKHTAYAVQWFAMAGTLVLVFVWWVRHINQRGGAAE